MPDPQTPSLGKASAKNHGAAIALLVAAALVLGFAGWYFSENRHLGGYSWGSDAFLIQGMDGAFAFSNGAFAPHDREPAPEAIFRPEGWPPVVIEQKGEGLRACSEETCAPLLSFGAPLDRPAAFTVSGDLLLILHPFVGDLQGYRLIPANPARIEPAFIIGNLGLATATGLVERERDSGEYLFVRPTEAGFEVCAATLASDNSSFLTRACAPYAAGAEIGDAVMTKLP